MMKDVTFALFFVFFGMCLSGMDWNIAQNWVEFSGVSEKSRR